MFELSPGEIPKAAIHNSKSFWDFHPKLAIEFEKLYPRIRLKDGGFPGLMPLLLAGVSPDVVMTWMLGGDNWEVGMNDLTKAHPFTADNGITKPNVERLRIFAPFIDTRQDQSSLKIVPGHPGEYAIVVSQASFTESVLVPSMKNLKVNHLVQVDGHSALANDQFNEAGIETLNVTTAFEILKELEARDLLNNDLVNVLCGVDLGNLPLIKTIRDKTDYEIAMLKKKRVPIGEGEQSDTIHEFIYGDVEGRRVILFDDMIGTGGTILKTVQVLLEKGAKEIIVCAAHAEFGGDGYYGKLRNLLQYPQVKIVMTSNTLPLKRPRPGGEKELPYIKVPGSSYPDEIKMVQMHNVDEFMGTILQAMMTSKTTPEIRKTLSGIEIVQESPKEIYKEITGEEMEAPKITHVYLEGGEFIPLSDYLAS